MIFQSTHPVRGATLDLHLRADKEQISIHAPRAGCDGKHMMELSLEELFQSTHPVRGATTGDTIKDRLHYIISIHAPRAGCD